MLNWTLFSVFYSSHFPGHIKSQSRCEPTVFNEQNKADFEEDKEHLWTFYIPMKIGTLPATNWVCSIWQTESQTWSDHPRHGKPDSPPATVMAQSWPGTMAMHVISVGLEEASPFFVSRARSRGMPPEPGRCRSIVACCCGTTKAPRRSCTCPICRMWAGHSWTWRNPKRLWKTTPDFLQWNTSLSGFASHGAGFVWRETSMSKMSKHSLPKHPRTGMVIRRTAHHSLVVLSKVN